MKGKKSVLVGIVLVSVVLSVVVVSAGFLDLFKFGDKGDGLEGELEASTDVSIEITGGSAPEIIYISDMSGGDYDLTNGCNTVAKFFDVYVYAQDLLGLPGASPSDTEVSVTLKESGGAIRTSHGVSSCVYNGPVSYDVNTDDIVNNDNFDNNILGVDGDLDSRHYTCTVVMQYYDISGINNWQVYAYIISPEDDDGYYDGLAGESPGVFGLPLPDRKTSILSTGTDYELSNTPLDFGAVGANNLDLNKLPVGGSPVFANCGNANIPNIGIIAQDIPKQGGTIGVDDFPVANRFFYDTSAVQDSSCDSSAETFTDNVEFNPAIPLATPFGQGSNNEIKICLDVTGEAGNYMTTLDIAWEIIA